MGPKGHRSFDEATATLLKLLLKSLASDQTHRTLIQNHNRLFYGRALSLKNA
jgi:hypothetical protein